MSPYPYCCRYDSADVSFCVSTGILCSFFILLFSILVYGTVVELRWMPSLVVLCLLNYPDEQSHTETAAESTVCSPTNLTHEWSIRTAESARTLHFLPGPNCTFLFHFATSFICWYGLPAIAACRTNTTAPKLLAASEAIILKQQHFLCHNTVASCFHVHG